MAEYNFRILDSVLSHSGDRYICSPSMKLKTRHGDGAIDDSVKRLIFHRDFSPKTIKGGRLLFIPEILVSDLSDQLSCGNFVYEHYKTNPDGKNFYMLRQPDIQKLSLVRAREDVTKRFPMILDPFDLSIENESQLLRDNSQLEERIRKYKARI